MDEVNRYFKYLFTPLEVGPIKLRNRIFVTPHATNFAADSNNLPGERLARYCAERAKGGASLVEVSMGVVSAGENSQSILSGNTEAHFSHLASGHPMTLSGRWPLNASDPRIVDGYSQLAKAVHEYGGKCAIEISAGGTNDGAEEGVSSYPYPSTTNVYTMPSFTPREMDEAAIEDLIEAFGRAAKYVKDSGLDGVDIHASHGAIVSEFLSAVMNRRTDKYGGSLFNRMRFLEEIIRRMREYVRNEIAVGMRLMGDEKFAGGNTPEVAAEICKSLDGKLDWITADTGYYPQHDDWQAVPMYVDSGYNMKITSPIKSVVKRTKVGVVGRYLDPNFAERLLAENLADMVAMTRALIADPELPNKAKDGRISEIRPCIGALQDCWGRMNRGLPISCTVNPVVSREKEWGIGSISKAECRKKILVIGAGPAGLETARLAAERGHDVVIYEKSQSVGGQALLAAKLPGRVDIRAIIAWEESQLSNLGVQVKYGLEVSSDPSVIDFVLDEERPDAVVIATGSTPLRNGFQSYTFQAIEGADLPNVCTEVDVLEKRIEIGHKVVVVDSLGFAEAPGTAEFLAREGRDVEIITYHPVVALELRLLNHYDHLLPRLYSLNIKMTPNTWVSKIAEDSILAYNVFYRNQNWTISGLDNVVLITGKIQNNSLYAPFKKRIKDTFLVGDSNLGGARIGNAIYDGQKIGRVI